MCSLLVLFDQAGEDEVIEFGEMFDDEKGWGALWKRTPPPVFFGPKTLDESLDEDI